MEGKSPEEGENLRKAVSDVLEKVGDAVAGLSVGEIYRRVRGKLPCSEAEVRAEVRRMEEEKLLDRRKNPLRRGYVYHLPGRGVLQGVLQGVLALEMRDEIEREERPRLNLWSGDEESREKAALSVMEAIARGHALEEDYAGLIREHAEELAEQDPVGLILDAAEWTVGDLNRLAGEIQGKKGSPGDIRRKTQELGFRRSKALILFRRLLRLDGGIKTEKEDVEGILEIPTVTEMIGGATAALDRKRAEARLKERVFGSRVVEILDVPENAHRAAAGSDASVADIEVPHRRGGFIPPTPAGLFVAAGALRVRGTEPLGNYWDYDIDPRDLERYEDLDAAVEGLLISPQLRREAVTDFRHLRSAMMDLRQYTEELRIVQRDAEWKPLGNVPEIGTPPPVGLLFRDGRIFPLVHRLEDYEGASAPDDVLYGEVVRREITRFRDVFHNTVGLEEGGALYAGATKSPEFSWLSMLVFWFLHSRDARAPADAFYRPPLNDQATAHLLFWALAEGRPRTGRQALVTFRVLRRFCDIALPAFPLTVGVEGEVRVLDENRKEDWEGYIERHIFEAGRSYGRHERGIPALSSPEDYAPFLYLCRKAAVAMFYAAPIRLYEPVVQAGTHFLLPRWETAVDAQATAEDVAGKTLSLLQWITDPGGLVRDEVHTATGFSEPPAGLPLMIPDVVDRAHQAGLSNL